MSDWRELTLSEVCTFENGDRGSNYPSKKVLVDSGIPFVNAGNLSNGKILKSSLMYVTPEKFNLLSRGKFSDGDILFCLRGSLGKFALVEGYEQGAIASSLVIIRPMPDLETKFFLYYLESEFCERMIAEYEGGAAQPNLSAKDLGKFLIPLPSLSEQKRIVAILDEAFGAIARAKENAARNLANARELFDSYLNRVFTEKGEGWEETTIGDSCTLKSGTTVKKAMEKLEGDIPYVKVADMNNEGNEIEIVSSSKFLSELNVKPNSVFPIGTTIFPKRGGAIATNKKRLTSVPVCCDLNIMGVIPPEKINPQFLYYYFLNVDMQLLGSGSSIPQINNYDISPLHIYIPEISIQNEIVERLSRLSHETTELKSHYRLKISALDELKQSLLQKAFTGQLTSKSKELELVP